MIEVKNLVKKYGNHTAVKNISFKVDTGKIYGFLGPNGAGKSTTMNIMTGCLSATDGNVIINGYDIYENPKEAKKCIGYLPELPPVYMDMTPEEYLFFVGKAKGVKGSELPSQIEKIMEMTGITNVSDRLIKNLSKGYRQRVGLAQALVGFPEVIILDEPMVGLDPKQIIEIRELIKSLKDKHTVFLSSHILSEISAICDYVLIISDGKLVASDTPENLSKHISGCLLDISVKGSRKSIVTAIRKIKGVKTVEVVSENDDGIIKLKIHSDNDIRSEVFFALCQLRMPIMELTSNNMSLEDIFLKLTEKNADEDDTSDDSDDNDSKDEDKTEYTPLFTSDVNNKEGDEE
ncbi:MAG: ABC transporter ATP-binding protein [Ruminococcaceae bacterium]|nr:ABC transporter ATP-binding protein [Oscillospiraceae bacterium]